jgi:SRSO17 transposase
MLRWLMACASRMVLADAGYGSSAGFRAGLTQRGLRREVGVQPTQKVYPDPMHRVRRHSHRYQRYVAPLSLRFAP